MYTKHCENTLRIEAIERINNNWNSDDLEVMHSVMPKRIQAVITTNGGVTKYKMTCQIFSGNEISFKIKCFVVTVLYMCFNKK